MFGRLVDERFESPEEARELIDSELTGEADGPAEYTEGRPLAELDDTEQ